LPLLGFVVTTLVMLGVFGLPGAVAMAVSGLQVAFFVASILVVGRVGL
jgi:hypothetical protein